MADDKPLYTLGEIVTRLMDERGIKHAKDLLALTERDDQPPVNKDTFSRLLNGKGTPDRATVARIAQVFGMSAQDLYERQRRPFSEHGHLSQFPTRRASDHAIDPIVVDIAKQIARLDKPARVMDLAIQIAKLDNPSRVVELAQQLAALTGPARLAVETLLVALEEAATRRA